MAWLSKDYNFSRKLLDLVNIFSRVAGYKKTVVFLYTNNKFAKKSNKGENHPQKLPKII